MNNSLDYDETDEMLDRAGAHPGAAEAHGLICGFVCGDFPHSLQSAHQEVLEDCDPDDAFVQECRSLLTQLHGTTKEDLDSPDLRFQLLLPDEESGNAARAKALTEWCQGFLYGFGVSAKRSEGRLSQDATDAIEDISEFTRLDFGAIDEENGDNAGALMELEEYLRVCVMVIYQDMQHNEEDGA